MGNALNFFNPTSSSSPINSLLGGGSGGGNQGGGPGASSVYVPQNSATNDASFQQLLQALTTQSNQGGTANSQVINNPYAAGMQSAANTAGTDLQQIGAADRTQGQNITQYANANLPYGTQILENAFDPQNALYGRTLQQTQDQARAANSAAGIGTSGAGVGLENQAVGNFNIDWQNNQLGRENTGLNAYDQFLNQYGNSLNTGANLKQQGATDIAEGGALPYNTANVGPMASLNALQQSSGLTQQSLSDILSYLGLGTNASSVANNSANQGFKNTGQLAGGLGGLLSSLMGGGGGGAAAASTGTDLFANAPGIAEAAFLL